ncbi:MAG TPA: hypothetical protein VFJ74_12615 [Gemmatimonadaceae bacterium]|nr:hypothetical protein [Gemmatimonadaceae bacterium]
MSERENDVEGQPRRGDDGIEAGEDVPREARSVEGIPASAQGDGEGDNLARDGALRSPHKVNPEIGEVGA